MTRDGLVERGAASGEETRISTRELDFDLHRARDGPEHADIGLGRESGASRPALRRHTGTPAQDGGQPSHDPAAEQVRPRSSGRRYPSGETAAHSGQPEGTAVQSGVPYRQQIHQEAAQPDPEVGNETPQAHQETAQPLPAPDGQAPQAQPGRARVQHGTQYGQRFQQEAAQAPPVTDGQTPQAQLGRPYVQHGTQYGQKFQQEAAQAPPATDGQAPQAQHGTRYGQKFQQEAAQAPPAPDGQAAQTQHGTQYGRKFRQETGKAPPAQEGGDGRPSKLAFTADELPPAAPDGKVTKAKRKAEQAADKLEAAQRRLPSYRKLRMETQSDPQTGKAKKRLRIEKEVKPQGAHVKGPLPLRPVKAGANAAVGYAHKKVYQAEEENVGTKAAHRTELAAEGGLRAAYRAHKTAPYRKVSRLQKKVTDTSARAAYQQALHDHPQLRKSVLSRMWQKRKLKRRYAKAARDARRAGLAAQKTAAATGKAAARVMLFVKRHPLLFGIIALLLFLAFLISSVFASCSNMGMSTLGGILASSYLAGDADIDNAELAYTEWETDLQIEISRAEIDHPGYDEYRYQVDGIGHDPHELMGFLSAVYQDFTYAQVQGVLREIFEEQYTLEFIEEVETRYRTEIHTDPETGERYEAEVPYEWRILNVNLTSRPFSELAAGRMDAGQQELCDMTQLTGGNRQYVANVFGGTDWLPYVTSSYGYRVHPISGAKDYHKGVDIGMPLGTEILAGHDGVVAQAGSASAYGLIVVLEGEAAEGQTLTTKYAHCSELLVSAGQEVKEGDVIARVGSTGNSTGPHLHLEVLVDGQYLNPLYFAAH